MSKEKKAYFADIIEGQEIFGLVFGHGVVRTVWAKPGDAHYTFEVEFDNHSTVAYTPEGFPSWGGGRLNFQTVYYKEDIDLMDLDFAPSENGLTPKKIIKLRDKKKLEVKCPSGLWQPVDKCPSYITEEYLESGKLHLFRKATGENK